MLGRPRSQCASVLMVDGWPGHSRSDGFDAVACQGDVAVCGGWPLAEACNPMPKTVRGKSPAQAVQARRCAIGEVLTTMQPQSVAAPAAVTVTPAASHTRRWLKKTYRGGIGCRAVPAAVLTDIAAQIAAGALSREDPGVARANLAMPASFGRYRKAESDGAWGMGLAVRRATPRFLPFWVVQLVDTARPAIFFEKSQSLVGRRPVRDQPACMLFLSFSYSQLVPQRSQT